MSESDSPQENPYAAPAARLADVRGNHDLALADRGTRLAAAILDGVVYVVAYLPIVFLIAASGDNAALPLIMALMGLLLVGIVVYNCVLLHRNGQTIAKKMLGIRIVRTDGSRAGLRRIVFLRGLPVALLGAIPLIGPLISLVDALLIFGDDRRCLHDQIADTIVVQA